MIHVLEIALRGAVTRAVNRELNRLRRTGVTGPFLLEAMAKLHDQHNLRDWVDRRVRRAVDHPIPKLVCSEALT